jgi:hypothetical protein
MERSYRGIGYIRGRPVVARGCLYLEVEYTSRRGVSQIVPHVMRAKLFSLLPGSLG